MAVNDKKQSTPRPYFATTNKTDPKNISVETKPYEGSQTFQSMRKKAEQTMVDHEFKG
jgi:hypothetical protein